MKFQNPSRSYAMHQKSVTDGHTNVPEAICPSNFFEVGVMTSEPQAGTFLTLEL